MPHAPPVAGRRGDKQAAGNSLKRNFRKPEDTGWGHRGVARFTSHLLPSPCHLELSPPDQAHAHPDRQGQEEERGEASADGRQRLSRQLRLAADARQGPAESQGQ